MVKSQQMRNVYARRSTEEKNGDRGEQCGGEGECERRSIPSKLFSSSLPCFTTLSWRENYMSNDPFSCRKKELSETKEKAIRIKEKS